MGIPYTPRGTKLLLMLVAHAATYMFTSGPLVAAFSHGAPDFSCRDPSTFHTRRVNATHEGVVMPQPAATSPYRLRVNQNTFTPGGRVTGTGGHVRFDII